MADEPQEPTSQGNEEIIREKVAEELKYQLQAYQGQAMPSTSGELGLSRRATVRQQLTMQLKEINERRAELIKLLAELDENPSVEKILDSMRKLGL